MKCQFCGWDNPQGKENCEKCNKPLTNCVESKNDIPSGLDNHARPTDRHASAVFNPKATIREDANTNIVNDQETQKCPECDYPLENGECSACGYSVSKESNEALAKVADEVRMTMRPIRKGEKESTFKLIPISEVTGMPEGETLHYEGNEVMLNRDNTDPKNKTITSHDQACLTLNNGTWCIEDKSEYKTTFVQASRKTELQSGDLILLGDQMYRFEL